jgi:hypothetical protein
MWLGQVEHSLGKRCDSEALSQQRISGHQFRFCVLVVSSRICREYVARLLEQTPLVSVATAKRCRNSTEVVQVLHATREAALGSIGSVSRSGVAGLVHHGQHASSACGRTHQLSRFHHGSSWILCCSDGVALEGAKNPRRKRVSRGRNLSGSNSVVESQPSKLLVAGSIPVSRSIG